MSDNNDTVEHWETTETCTNCGGSGFSGHDCGEDTCCCLEPEEDLLCSVCEGVGVLVVTE